ncbi:MAG: glycosyltransferase [Ignavibacteriales bacterium]|nr:MAG: glycosyltransferase [Ignavibacteriales bacterium]
MILFFIVTFFLLITTCIVVYNFFSAPSLANKPTSDSPFISVLIAARNEEKNISQCLENIQKQTYNNFEVLVLDDESTDGTSKIVEQHHLKDKRINLLSGEPLPENWKGKNWACHQLSQKAKGDKFLFIDADVRISPDTLSKAVSTLNLYRCSLLTIFPTQIISSFGEFFIVPLMNWLLLTFLPLKLVYKSSIVSFTAANGQFMLWEKDIYKKIGGHKTIGDKVVEDMELARLVKKNSGKVLTVLGDSDVFCRMYTSFMEGFNGFSKNFFPGFNIHPILFLLFISFLFLLYISPVLLFFVQDDFIIPLVIIFVQRLLISLKSRQRILSNVILHPFQIFVMLITGINSVISISKNKLFWKGRRL